MYFYALSPVNLEHYVAGKQCSVLEIEINAIETHLEEISRPRLRRERTEN